MLSKASQKVTAAVRQTIEEHSMLSAGESVLVGVSGGADSVCLLHLLHAMQGELKIKVYAAHINHRIRGSEAERDQQFVRRLCETWEIPLIEQTVDVPQLAEQEEVSLETAGRLARYRCFREICISRKIEKIATAHNRNDQAETVLMRMIRGTGIDGLAGIKYCRQDNVVRPLLDVERPAIEEYCTENGLTWCTDSTNNDEEYTRNRIRNQLIPELCKSFNPEIVRTLSNLAKNMAEDSAFISGYTQRLYQRINNPAPSKKPVVLDIESLLMVDDAIRSRLIRCAAQEVMGKQYFPERRHIQGISQLLDKETGAQTQLPGGLCVAVRYGWLAFEVLGEREEDAPGIPQACYPVEPDKGYTLNGWNITFKITDLPVHLKTNQMILDYDKVRNLSLAIRNRCPGDWIAVYQDGRRRKLKDFMIDMKIPKRERGSIPLLCCDEGQVLAVIGHRVAEPYKSGEDSKRGLVITYDTVDEGR